MTNPTAKPVPIIQTQADVNTINAARMIAAQFLPWWSPVIRQLKLDRNDDQPTMCVNSAGRVYYNLEFIRKLKAELGLGAIAFCLLHEGMHMISNTHKRAAAVGADQDAQLAMLFNIASDMSINTILKQEAARSNCQYKIVIPEWVCLPEKFDLPPNLSAEEYYLRLLSMREKASGACDGSPGNGCGMKDEGGGKSQAQINAIKKQMADAAAGSLKRGEGALGDLLAIPKEVPPKVDWRKQLVHVALRLTNMIAGSDDSTYSRRNVRNFDELNAPVLPGTCSYELSVVVIGDTSGSMHNHLGKITTEVSEIVKILGKVTFIACDAQVHAAASVNGKADVAANLKGGGGTDMKPAFEAAMAYKPTLIVCITDGCIGDPGNFGIKTIWCLTEPYTRDVQPSVDEGWGTIVECVD